MSEMCWGSAVSLPTRPGWVFLEVGKNLWDHPACKVFLGTGALAGMVNLSSWKGRMLWKPGQWMVGATGSHWAPEAGGVVHSCSGWLKFRSRSEIEVWELPGTALKRGWTHSKDCGGRAQGTECAVGAGRTCSRNILGIRAKVCPWVGLCLEGRLHSSWGLVYSTPTAGSGPSPDGCSLSGSWSVLWTESSGICWSQHPVHPQLYLQCCWCSGGVSVPWVQVPPWTGAWHLLCVSLAACCV